MRGVSRGGLGMLVEDCEDDDGGCGDESPCQHKILPPALPTELEGALGVCEECIFFGRFAVRFVLGGGAAAGEERPVGGGRHYGGCSRMTLRFARGFCWSGGKEKGLMVRFINSWWASRS